MTKMKLTKTNVDGLAPKARAYVVRDCDLAGFCVRVGKTGTKRWLIEYRPYPGGRGVSKKQHILGPTNVVTAKAARDEAQQLLAAVKAGADPAAEKAEARNVNLFIFG